MFVDEAHLQKQVPKAPSIITTGSLSSMSGALGFTFSFCPFINKTPAGRVIQFLSASKKGLCLQPSFTARKCFSYSLGGNLCNNLVGSCNIKIGRDNFT